jgi:hypothetical protein
VHRTRRQRGYEQRHAWSLGRTAAAEVSRRLTIRVAVSRVVTDGKSPRNASVGNLDRTDQH